MWFISLFARRGGPRATRRRSASARLSVEALEGRAVPAFLTPVSTPSTGGVTAGDFNNDGRDDLLRLDRSSNTVSVLLSNGDGSFQVPRSFAAGKAPLGLAVGDLNNDGRL